MSAGDTPTEAGENMRDHIVNMASIDSSENVLNLTGLTCCLPPTGALDLMGQDRRSKPDRGRWGSVQHLPDCTGMVHSVSSLVGEWRLWGPVVEEFIVGM